MDGQTRPLSGGGLSVGTMPSTIWIGRRADGTRALTTANLRNLKMDRVLARVQSGDSSIGPGLQDEAAFFGGTWVNGVGSTGGLGGFASQVAEAKYGTTYYWMGCNWQDPKLLGTNGMLEHIWKPWAGASTAPSFVGMCIQTGWDDILAGSTATDIWTGVLQVLEGGAASATWTPPTLTSPHAFAVYGAPSSGTDTFTLNGRSFSVPFNTTKEQTILDLVAAIQADGPSDALFEVAPQTSPPFPTQAPWTMWIKVRAQGTVGNGYTVTSAGVGGAVCFGDVGGLPGGGLSVTTFNGVDQTVTIDTFSFVANFDTDANTTINNLVTDVMASGAAAIVTVANTGLGTMSCIANTKGYSGNAIRVGGNGTGYALGSPGGWGTNRTLAGGFNGAVASGVNPIILCNVPPIGTCAGYSAPKDAERASLNALIGAYVAAGVTIYDLDNAVRDPGAHQNLLPAYDAGGGFLNNAGHAAVATALGALLP